MSLSTLASADHVWASPHTIQIPTDDIVSFAFGNLSKYDKSAPIFIDAKDPSNRISAAEALETVRQLIKGLRDLGLKEGECVCLHAHNNIWYPVIWLGIIGAGGCVTGTNPRHKTPELGHQLQLTEPRFIIAQGEGIDDMIEAASKCNIPTSNIFCILHREAPPPSGCRHWEELLTKGGDDWTGSPGQDGWTQERIAMYGMTSGTTGLPKAAMISHRYIVAQTAVLEAHFRARPSQGSQLICLPVFHAFASGLALVLPLRLGLTTFFLPKWSHQEALQAIQAHSVTNIPVSPPIVAALQDPSSSDPELLSSLRYVICAGAALSEDHQKGLEKILHPDAVVVQSWGTTETGWTTLPTWEERKTSARSVGNLLPNVQLKLVDRDGKTVRKEGIKGEAFILTPTKFSGYLGNPEATEEAFDSDGFYRTGDRVEVVGDKVHYCERLKETMKVRGWQVSPTEIENVLLKHHGISDVAVNGVERKTSGLVETLPTAYVVRADPDMSRDTSAEASLLRAPDVKAYVAARLISYKHLTGGVVFIKNVPRSVSGKILRQDLLTADTDPRT